MKKLGAYYVICALLSIAAVILFWSRINLHWISLLPLFFIGLMIYNAVLVGAEAKSDDVGDTAYSAGGTVRLLNSEQACQFSYLKWGFLICIPLEIPFVFFLPWYLKLLSLLPFFLSYMIGGLMFKAKMGRAIEARLDEESEELSQQIKREESGEI